MNAKIKGIVKNSVFKFMMFAFLIALAAASVTKSSGIFRTLPLVFILPSVATFFYNKKLLSATLCAISSVIFLTVENKLTQTIWLSVLVFVFALLGILVKRFFITAFVSVKKRIFCTICGIVLLVFGFFSYSYIFGNPISHQKFQKLNKAYILQTCRSEDLEINYSYYDYKTKKYYTNISFFDVTSMNADISAYGDEIFDGYSNYYEYKLLSLHRETLAELLSEKFDMECAVRINIEETEILNAKDFAENDVLDPKSTSEMVFDVAFYAQLSQKEDFLKACQRISKILYENNFNCKKINLYGGFADEFLYKFTLDFPMQDFFDETVSQNTEKIVDYINQNIVPFEERAFQRYFDDSEYALGWEYGK